MGASTLRKELSEMHEVLPRAGRLLGSAGVCRLGDGVIEPQKRDFGSRT